MGIIQNSYDQHGNAQDDLEFFICTHKASLPSKTQGGNRSRSTGCPGKYIILSGCGPCGGAGAFSQIYHFLLNSQMWLKHDDVAIQFRSGSVF